MVNPLKTSSERIRFFPVVVSIILKYHKYFLSTMVVGICDSVIKVPEN